MLKQSLTLSAAYATWVLDEDDDKWIVRDKDANKIGEFPAKWKEKDCMTAIKLGRKYELEAFNIGISFGKEAREKSLLPIIEQLNIQVKVLEQMNERLSSKLEQLIIGDNAEE